MTNLKAKFSAVRTHLRAVKLHSPDMPMTLVVLNVWHIATA